MTKHIISLGILSAFTIIALSNTTVVYTQTAREEIRETRQEINEARCTIAETRIERLVTKYENITEKDTQDGEELLERIDSIISALNEEDIATDTLQALSDDLEQSLSTYTSSAEELVTSLETTQEFACGESEGAFFDALQTSRANYTQAKSDRLEVRQDMEAIRGELSNIKEQL